MPYRRFVVISYFCKLLAAIMLFGATDIYCEDCETRLQQIATKCKELIPIIQKKLDNSRAQQQKAEQERIGSGINWGARSAGYELKLKAVENAIAWFSGEWKLKLDPSKSVEVLGEDDGEYDCEFIIDFCRPTLRSWMEDYPEWNIGHLIQDKEKYPEMTLEELEQLLSEPTVYEDTGQDYSNSHEGDIKGNQELPPPPELHSKVERDAVELLIGAARDSRIDVHKNADGSVSISFKSSIGGSVGEPKEMISGGMQEIILTPEQADRVREVLDYSYDKLHNEYINNLERRGNIQVSTELADDFRGLLETSKDARDIAMSMAIDIPALMFGDVLPVLSIVSTASDAYTIYNFDFNLPTQRSVAEILGEFGGVVGIESLLLNSRDGLCVIRDWAGSSWMKYCTSKDYLAGKEGFFADPSTKPPTNSDITGAMGRDAFGGPGGIPDQGELQELIGWMQPEDWTIARNILDYSDITERLIEVVYLDNSLNWFLSEIGYVDQARDEMR